MKLLEKARINTFLNRPNVFVAVMLSVALLNFMIFWVIVNSNSVLMAFQDQNANDSLTISHFTRLLKDLFSNTSILPEAVKNTLSFFALNMLIILPISIFFSYFLYKKIKGYQFFRVIFFLPSIISPVVLVSIYKQLIGSNGPLITLLKGIGIENTPSILTDFAMPAILLYVFWTSFGVNIILFGGAMSRLPEEVIEAGRIDGVIGIKELGLIVIPLIWPTISTVVVLGVVGLFIASGPILLFTDGTRGTMTISFWIFDQVRSSSYGGSLNYASAVGLFFTMIGLPIVLIVKKLLGKIYTDVEY